MDTSNTGSKTTLDQPTQGADDADDAPSHHQPSASETGSSDPTRSSPALQNLVTAGEALRAGVWVGEEPYRCCGWCGNGPPEHGDDCTAIGILAAIPAVQVEVGRLMAKMDLDSEEDERVIHLWRTNTHKAEARAAFMEARRDELIEGTEHAKDTVIRALVAERDALLVRVKETEASLRSEAALVDRMRAYWGGFRGFTTEGPGSVQVWCREVDARRRAGLK